MCLSKRCPKCNGDLFYEAYPGEDSSLVCLQCGWSLPMNSGLLRTGKTVSTPVAVKEVHHG